MPKEKESHRLIPKIYRRKYEDLSMFFWVLAQQKIIPTCTDEQALYSYFNYIKDEDFNIECARVTLSRMRAEFIDLNYNETSKKNI